MVQQNLDIDHTAYTGPVHYFASCALGWATAETADAAIRKLASSFRREFTNMVKGGQKRGNAGAYIWTCKVHGPSDSQYEINFYAPQGIDISEGQNHYVTYITQKAIAYCSLKNNDLISTGPEDK